MKRRITVSVASEVLEQLDRTPGASRSEKVEDLLRLGLAAQEYQSWVRELRAFYDAGPDAKDSREDLEWQSMADQVLTGDDSWAAGRSGLCHLRGIQSPDPPW